MILQPNLLPLGSLQKLSPTTNLWEPGVWRFVVAGWSVDKLRISIDGAPFRETPLKTAIGDLNGRIFLKSDERTQLDELVVLGRALSDAEVKELYDSFGAR